MQNVIQFPFKKFRDRIVYNMERIEARKFVKNLTIVTISRKSTKNCFKIICNQPEGKTWVSRVHRNPTIKKSCAHFLHLTKSVLEGADATV